MKWRWYKLAPLLALFYALTCSPGLTAQPDLQSLREVRGVKVFADLADTNRYYYLPGPIELAKDYEGRPRVKLIQMRYLGRGVTGDRGEATYLNFLQLSVDRAPALPDSIEAARSGLGPSTRLGPLPLSHVETHLIAPAAAQNDRNRVLGRSSGGAGGLSTENWTERTFTIRMDNEEAEIMWAAVETGRLGCSIGYTYFADVVDGAAGSYQITGDSALAASLAGHIAELTTPDSTVRRHAVRAGAFPINVDLERWPETRERIDINGRLPPSWAYLEALCYDFTNELRPDLARKSIEIEATGVTGAPIVLRPIRFNRHEPAAFTRQIHFPLAVDLHLPYRFRVTEYTLAGKAHPGNWQTREDWTAPLDVTTPPEASPYTRYDLELEADLVAFRDAGVDTLTLQLLYTRGAEPTHETVTWQSDGNNALQTRRIFADRGTTMYYHIPTQSADAERPIHPLPTDGYLFLQPSLRDN